MGLFQVHAEDSSSHSLRPRAFPMCPFWRGTYSFFRADEEEWLARQSHKSCNMTVE